MNKLTAPSLIVCSIEAGKKSQDCKMITFAFGATLITVNKKCTSTMDFCIFGVKSSLLVRLGVSHWRRSHMTSGNFPTISHRCIHSVYQLVLSSGATTPVWRISRIVIPESIHTIATLKIKASKCNVFFSFLNFSLEMTMKNLLKTSMEIRIMRMVTLKWMPVSRVSIANS